MMDLVLKHKCKLQLSTPSDEKIFCVTTNAALPVGAANPEKKRKNA